MVGDAKICDVGACCNTDCILNNGFGLFCGTIDVCCIVAIDGIGGIAEIDDIDGISGCVGSFIAIGVISSFVLRPRFFGVVTVLLLVD